MYQLSNFTVQLCQLFYFYSTAQKCSDNTSFLIFWAKSTGLLDRSEGPKLVKKIKTLMELFQFEIFFEESNFSKIIEFM